MKKFVIYSLIVLALVGSISTAYIMTPIIPKAEAWESIVGCAISCFGVTTWAEEEWDILEYELYASCFRKCI